MTQKPLISIITPSFNCADTIEETIRSVESQTYPYVEHIVIDGGSTDGTVDILKRYPHLVWISEKDEGQADALNKGFRMAKGNVIAWLNADDTYASTEVLQEVMDLFAHNTNVDLIHGDVIYLDPEGNFIHRHQGKEFNLAEALLSNPINQQATFFRRRVFEKVGFLRTDLDYVMDYEFWLRIGRRCKSLYVPHVWATYCLKPGSKTVEHPERFWLEALDVFDSLFALPQVATELKSVRSLAYGRMHWLAGVGLYRAGEWKNAREHCSVALQVYKLLEKDYEFAIQGCRYIESHYHREPHSPDWIEDLLADLPPEFRRNGRFMSQIRSFFYATRADFYASRRRWREVRKDTLRAFRYDFVRWINNRGFIKQGFRAIGALIRKEIRQPVRLG